MAEASPGCDRCPLSGVGRCPLSEVHMYSIYREVNRGQELCPMYRGCPLFGGSVIRGFTVYRVRDPISATIYYRTRLQNLCITGTAAFSDKV